MAVENYYNKLCTMSDPDQSLDPTRFPFINKKTKTKNKFALKITH